MFIRTVNVRKEEDEGEEAQVHDWVIGVALLVLRSVKGGSLGHPP